MLHSIVYLPLELKYRELDARLMTAAHLLNAGISVVFGQQWAMWGNGAVWPPGVILFKTVNEIQAAAMTYFYKLGYLVAATDEEVLTSVDNFSIALSPRAIESCHLLLAQSELHKADLERRFPEIQGRIIVTGSPRVEITSRSGRQAFQAEADEIRRKVGPFVLLNTNYSGINSVWGALPQVFEVLVKAGLINSDDPNAPKLFESMMNWERANRKGMIAFLDWAANSLRGRRVVIRPHPSERPEYWQGLVNNHPNVDVVLKSHHLPWIMASDLVVHTSCTTGLEAALLDKPALNIQSAPDPLGARITSLVNPTFATSGEAIAAANAFLHENAGPLADMGVFKTALEKFFPGYQEGGPARRIAEECMAILAKHHASDASQFDWASIGPHYQKAERSELRAEKFSMSTEEVVGALDAVCRKIGVTRKVKVTPIDDSLFLFQPE